MPLNKNTFFYFFFISHQWRVMMHQVKSRELTYHISCASGARSKHSTRPTPACSICSILNGTQGAHAHDLSARGRTLARTHLDCGLERPRTPLAEGCAHARTCMHALTMRGPGWPRSRCIKRESVGVTHRRVRT